MVSGALHGQQRFWSLSGRPIFQDRNFIGYRGVGTDVTQTHWAQESASFRARHDLLTGLPNRGAFLDDMETYLIEAERTGKPSRCSISIWTASSRSTTGMATPPATRCSGKSPSY